MRLKNLNLLYKSMRKLILVAALLLMPVVGHALNELSSYRVGSKVFRIGEHYAAAEKKMRADPTNVIELVNGYGAYIGERREYIYNKKQLVLIIARDGKTIARILRE